MNENSVAIYIRVSTNYQIDKDSLPMQRKDLVSYCQLILNTDRYVIYEDAGYSGKNTSRPRYQDMMNDIRSGKFTHLLVWKIDRISRNLLDFSEMYAELKTLGVTFVSMNEQFDTSTAIGEAMLKIILVFAELERKMTSERVTATMLSRASKGEWNGGQTPYGYDFDKKTRAFSINENESKVIKFIFDTYIEKKSYRSVAIALNRNGYKTRAGDYWASTTINGIINNPFYTGVYRYNVHISTNRGIKDEDEWIVIQKHHPAIISKQKFNKAAEIVSKKKSSSSYATAVRNTKNVHVFSGIIKCGNCGNKMYPSKKKTLRFASYYCSNRYFANCTNGELSEQYIGQFVLTLVSNILKIRKLLTFDVDAVTSMLLDGLPSYVTGVSSESVADLIDILTADSDDTAIFGKTKATKKKTVQHSQSSPLKKELAKYKRALDRLTELYLFSDVAMSEKEFTIKKDDIVKNIDRLSAELDATTISEDTTISDSDFVLRASEFILSNKLSSADEINYKELSSLIDNRAFKEFFLSILSHIVITSRCISEIKFANGLVITFNIKCPT